MLEARRISTKKGIDSCSNAKVDVFYVSEYFSTLEGQAQEEITLYRNEVHDIFSMCPHTLFISAAGQPHPENELYTEGQIITNKNSVPSGIQTPNHITVGGYNFNYFKEIVKDERSHHGSLVDIYAPYTFPVLAMEDNGKCPYQQDMGGTSFSAPQVAALAAIIKSINPNLTPEQIKDLILFSAKSPDLNFPVDKDFSDLNLLKFTYPVQQAMLDLFVHEKVLDIDVDGITDRTAEVLHRICAESTLKIGEREFVIPTEAFAVVLQANGLTGFVSLEEENFSFQFHITPPGTRLGYSYNWISEVNTASFNWGNETQMAGTSIPSSGGLFFEECFIMERGGLSNSPMTVDFVGSMYGKMDSSDIDDFQCVVVDFSMKFRMPIFIFLDASESQIFDIETGCYGGYGSPLEDWSVSGSCGDGSIHRSLGEICDADNLGGATCVNIGYTYESGTLQCDSTCKRWDTSQCVAVSNHSENLGTWQGSAFIRSGNFCDGTATELYFPAADIFCTGSTASGSERVFQVIVPAGNTLHITFQSEFDNSIYLVREYSDLQGATCLQGIDANHTAPYVEELNYTNTSSTPETIFIVIDHFEAICAFYPEIQFSLTIEP